MRDRKNVDVIGESNEHDVIREVVDRKAPHVAVCNSGNERPRFGKLLEVQERLLDFGGKPVGYVAASFPVPGGCLT
jgi:hypothetical protein